MFYELVIVKYDQNPIKYFSVQPKSAALIPPNLRNCYD